MNLEKSLSKEFEINLNIVKNIVKLILDGNTIPFIARYRKEMTNNMDDQKLRSFETRMHYIISLNEKRDTIIKSMVELGVMTDQILNELQNASTYAELENIYRPFRPKKRTKAAIAKEMGFMPLAECIMKLDDVKSLEFANNFINSELGIETTEACIEKAMDIVIEIISDNPKIRSFVKEEIINHAKITTSKVKEQDNKTYAMYYDFETHIKKVNNHNILAINRAEKEGIIKVALVINDEFCITKSYDILLKSLNKKGSSELVLKCVKDALKKNILPSIHREVRSGLTERAEKSSVKIFSQNLKQLLMQAPIKDKVVMGIDPAYRTGCKLAIVDKSGKLLEYGVIYPHPPKGDIEKSKKIILDMIKKYSIDLISIGNGKASIETERFVIDVINSLDLDIDYIIINEAGASVYSASKVAAEEFPELDASIRSAVSIARRAQDPLAELVKIEPQSIGIGQYQHDITKKLLEKSLSDVVEDCVNTVGVDINTASLHLLNRISGLNKKIASNIIKFRDENGVFKNRKELLKVSGLGEKAFLQSAGFLRISKGENILDSTAIHPESYKKAKALLEKLEIDLKKINKECLESFDEKLNIADIQSLSKTLNIGIHTLTDMIQDLKKPGRDPRTKEQNERTKRKLSINIETLKSGDKVIGTVRNIIDFGAFIDIGVGQDGLVHISNMSTSFVKNPLDILSVGESVEVTILDIDSEKKRISLSMI